MIWVSKCILGHRNRHQKFKEPKAPKTRIDEPHLIFGNWILKETYSNYVFGSLTIFKVDAGFIFVKSILY